MQALGDIFYWWHGLSGHLRIVYVAVSVIVVGALGIALYHGYSGAVPLSPTDIAQTRRALPPLHSSSILSLPLPGTQQRKRAEAARLLESVLSDYDYIAAARATFAISPVETETDQAVHLSLQLRFQPASILPDNWLDNLVTFVLHTVPGLQPADLLITDSHGELLYASGQATPIAASLVSVSLSPPALVSESKAVFKIPSVAWGLAALIATILTALYLLQTRRGDQQDQTTSTPAASRPSQLHQFLSGLDTDQITSLGQGERPEIETTILHHVPNPKIAAAAWQQMNVLPKSLSEPTRPLRKEILVSFTKALRSKLAEQQNNLGNGGEHSERTAAQKSRHRPEGPVGKAGAI